MSQEVHITSSAISDIQRNLESSFIPALQRLQRTIADTDVAFPGFGVTLGWVVTKEYSARQDDMRDIVDDAIETIQAWITALETIKQNWRDAEFNSTVVYR